MTDDNPPRKKRWGWLKPSRSDPSLEERGRRAASDPSALLPSSNAPRGQFSGLIPKLFGEAKSHSVRSARQSPNLEPTAATSSSQDPLRPQTSQDPSSLIASTPEPNFDQSFNADISKSESPPDIKLVTETLAHTQTSVTGISPIQGIIQNFASVSDNLQSVPDTIDTFSKILGPLKAFNSVADKLADVRASSSFSSIRMQKWH
ncbi:hypothetical protein DEU56DRAFT_901596 [Suillus clintonianus]|uniref:uncharacterized protein n=1 Tax=Suillus clintonianus TaxID=1904413 RepID=UPI001B87BDC7|nr:uncharacterized protein DEU56DRAFT_901596 [Suillus clintonianus]KAG2136391.1 hypothetical protein DEU56DRAFT_901596 [Suillus clintonianus]